MSKVIWAKYVLPAILLIAGLIVSLFSLQALEQYDYTLVTFNRPVTWDDSQTVKLAVGAGTESAVFTRSRNGYLSCAWKRNAFVTVYTCSEKFFEIARLQRVNGRFLWDSDSRERTSYAVIDENLAVYLFAGKDCIGEKVTVGGAEYAIVGVCTSEDGVFSSVDEYAIYLPIDAYIGTNTQCGCLLRSADDISLTFLLQKGIAVGGGIQSAENLKTRAGMWSMPARFALFLIYVITLVVALQILIKYLRLRWANARVELDSMYPREFVHKHISSILLQIVLFIVLCGIFTLWLRAVRFTVVLDAALIPPSLIDISGWIDHITLYTRAYNNTESIPFSPYYQIGVYGCITSAAAVISLVAAWQLLQGLKERVTAFFESYLDNRRNRDGSWFA